MAMYPPSHPIAERFGQADASEGRRDLALAMRRGAFGRCPHCGEGRLFRAYLKVAEACNVCGEEFHHHRADDLPAYVVIVIVGHIVVGGLLSVETYTAWPVWVHAILWPALTIALTLGLLPPVKGAIVGLQWALHMHGFASQPDGDDNPVLKPRPETGTPS
jgi:uncharacterized protein (DUF983 family)